MKKKKERKKQEGQGPCRFCLVTCNIKQLRFIPDSSVALAKWLCR